MNEQITQLQQQIAEAQKEIEAIRAACPHTDTYEGIWEWAPGHQFPALICNNCGIAVKSLTPVPDTTVYSVYPYTTEGPDNH